MICAVPMHSTFQKFGDCCRFCRRKQAPKFKLLETDSPNSSIPGQVGLAYVMIFKTPPSFIGRTYVGKCETIEERLRDLFENDGWTPRNAREPSAIDFRKRESHLANNIGLLLTKRNALLNIWIIIFTVHIVTLTSTRAS
ncbi:hypothetical protein TNCV_1807681 [Trichonephila clavipes]|nr:hypothetical protein TNCV_1807681 [Trichonephila clavipes]